MVIKEKSIPASPVAGRVQQLDSPEGSASGRGREAWVLASAPDERCFIGFLKGEE